MSKIYDIVDLVGSNQFTYQLYKDISCSVSGTGNVTSSLNDTTNWTLVNTINTSPNDATSFYRTNSRLYFFISDPVTDPHIKYIDTPETGGLTDSGITTTFGQNSITSFNEAGTFYNFSAGVFGLFVWDEAVTTSWSEFNNGLATDYYDSNINVVFNGFLYGCPSFVASNGIVRLDWANRATATDNFPGTTGFPSSGTTTNWFKDSTYLYVIVAGISNSKIYRSSNGTTWNLFYTFSNVTGTPAKIFINNINYLLVDISGSSTYSLFTLSDGGSTPSLSDTGIPSSTNINGLHSDGTNIYGLVIDTNTIEIWKKP